MFTCTYFSASAPKLVTLEGMTTRAPRLAEADLAAWRAFLAAHARIVGDIETALREEELPPLSWYDVLWPLYRAPGHRLRIKELAEVSSSAAQAWCGSSTVSRGQGCSGASRSQATGAGPSPY